MKKIFSITGTALCLAFLSNQVKATDLVVAAGGAGGAYASLNAALTAAANNDRIIVYPQPGGASFSEGTITITKSVQILSAVEGGFYAVDGTINIAPSAANRSITIIGMKLFTGGIYSTITAPVGARCAVKLVNDSIMNNSVSIDNDNYDLTLANSYLGSGNITFRFGKVIGNLLASGTIAINTDASVNNPNDTVMIIGNKINCYTNGGAGIYWTSTSQFFSIQNNFVVNTYIGYATGSLINVTTSKASVAGTNVVTNNSAYRNSGYYSYYGLLIQTNATSTTEIQNNIIYGPTAYADLYTSGGSHSNHYNYGGNNGFVNFTNDGTNIALTNTSFDADGKITNPLSNAINGGNPDSAYVDINLTRNDAGCYGGSFTMDNFYPNGANDWARVFLVTAPRRVLVNGTISVKAYGFDK